MESIHVPTTDRPDPLIPRKLIKGVTERIDSAGEEIIPLYEHEAEEAVKELLAEGVDGICVVFLWSFLNDSHEMKVKEIIELIQEGAKELNNRFIILENYESGNQHDLKNVSRKVIEKRIENDQMDPIKLGCHKIKTQYKNSINKMKRVFEDFVNKNTDFDNFQKKGRLNNKFIKTITSDFTFTKCFTRKVKQKILKILLLVDISGSMNSGRGSKLESAKIAMVMICEALCNIARLRIVLFTGERDARNILIKDFEENIDYKKLDLFGCHKMIKSNLDGVSIKYEASKLENEELIIVISDGQPAGHNYRLNDAIIEIHEVRKRYKIFAFSIDANGEHLDKLYGKSWILTKSNDKEDLSNKILKFCKIIVKEFFF
jgi:uncharacterized protein YegL